MRTTRPTLPLLATLLALCAGACGGEPTSDDATPVATPPPVDTPTPPPPAGEEDSGDVQPLTPVQTTLARIEDPGLPVVREYTRMFFDGELEALHASFSDEMKENLPLERLQAFRERVLRDWGTETELLTEQSQVREGYRGFARFARFDKYDGVILIQWILYADSDTVAGFYVEPAKRNPSGS